MRPCGTTRRQSGVGIIEVLVALVVVSFGVLGMAGLQLTGMKHSTSGYNRSKAVLLAENLVARMRANPVGVDAFSYNGYDSGTDASCGVQPNPYCQATAGAAAASCSAGQMAAFDLFSIACGNWSSAGSASDGVIDGLPNGQLVVSCDDAPCNADSNYTVVITWDEIDGTSEVEGTTDGKRVQVRFNP